MKYLIIRIRNGEWKCIYASNDKDMAVTLCNEYNRMDESSRYTLYQEAEV